MVNPIKSPMFLGRSPLQPATTTATASLKVRKNGVVKISLHAASPVCCSSASSSCRAGNCHEIAMGKAWKRWQNMDDCGSKKRDSLRNSSPSFLSQGKIWEKPWNIHLYHILLMAKWCRNAFLETSLIHAGSSAARSDIKQPAQQPNPWCFRALKANFSFCVIWFCSADSILTLRFVWMQPTSACTSVSSCLAASLFPERDRTHHRWAVSRSLWKLTRLGEWTRTILSNV